jgi:hypothetical protein
MRASGGICAPHWVQKAAGGVERWQVGQRISPGLGVAIPAALCLPLRPIARIHHCYALVPMERINVVGTSCSGKTQLARALASRLDLPHVELDALFWGEGWTPVAPELFRERVAAAAAGPRWVIDGGYSPVRDLIWGRVDTVVWLDYPMRTVLRRWARRTVRRIRSGDEFWPGTGNRESIKNALRRDGLLWWILRTHRRRRRTLAMQLAARPDIRAIHLRSPESAEVWLRGIAGIPAPGER